MKPKVLIATAWWPTKTKCFKEFSRSVIDLLESENIDVEFFISTTFAKTKFESISGSLSQAEKWALEFNFTHVLILDADMVVYGKNSLAKLIELKKDVVMPGRGSGSGTVLFSESAADNDSGWGCCLIKTEVLREIPLSSGLTSDYLWLDTMWFKKVRLSGIKIWKCYDIIAKPLEGSSSAPALAFQPN